MIKTRRGQRRGGGKDEEGDEDDDQCVPGRDSALAAPFPRKTQQLLAMYVFSFDQMHLPPIFNFKFDQMKICNES